MIADPVDGQQQHGERDESLNHRVPDRFRLGASGEHPFIQHRKPTGQREQENPAVVGTGDNQKFRVSRKQAEKRLLEQKQQEHDEDNRRQTKLPGQPDTLLIARFIVASARSSDKNRRSTTEPAKLVRDDILHLQQDRISRQNVRSKRRSGPGEPAGDEQKKNRSDEQVGVDAKKLPVVLKAE